MCPPRSTVLWIAYPSWVPDGRAGASCAAASPAVSSTAIPMVPAIRLDPAREGRFLVNRKNPADLHHHKPHLKKHCWNPNPLICVELSLRNLFERRLTLAGRRCKLHYRMKAGLRLEPWMMGGQVMHA